jgi:hypothetical protein
MRSRLVTRTLGTAAALAAGGAVLLGGAAAPAGFRAQAPKKITAAGVGQVKLGKTHRQLRAAGLVGRLHVGCPLAGPDNRAANLRAPLRGSVNYSRGTPRRAENIIVSRGGEARGVGIGDAIPEIRAAFPKAKVDRSQEDVFRVTLVNIPRDGGGRLQFAVDVDTKRVTLIGIPLVAFCD